MLLSELTEACIVPLDGVHWPPVGTAVATLPVHELSQVAEPHGV